MGVLPGVDHEDNPFGLHTRTKDDKKVGVHADSGEQSRGERARESLRLQVVVLCSAERCKSKVHTNLKNSCCENNKRDEISPPAATP